MMQQNLNWAQRESRQQLRYPTAKKQLQTMLTGRLEPFKGITAVGDVGSIPLCLNYLWLSFPVLQTTGAQLKLAWDQWHKGHCRWALLLILSKIIISSEMLSHRHQKRPGKSSSCLTAIYLLSKDNTASFSKWLYDCQGAACWKTWKCSTRALTVHNQHALLTSWDRLTLM